VKGKKQPVSPAPRPESTAPASSLPVVVSDLVHDLGRTLGTVRNGILTARATLAAAASDPTTAESAVTDLEAACAQLDSTLADMLVDNDRAYDTMLKLRWAVLGVHAPGNGSRENRILPFTRRGDLMAEHKPVVYVVDDNPSVRRALQRLLRSVGLTVTAFSSARQFLEHDHTACPACVVLDVRMPRMSGLDLQQELADRDTDLPIIFITGHGDINMAVKAMKDGAVDFLPKPFNDQDLLDSINRALSFHLDIRDDRAQREEINQRVDLLTPREREVLAMVVTGMLNKQIGYDLGTTEKTIKVHRARVMEKMQAESLADLVRMAAKVGIEGPHGPGTPSSD